MQSAPSTQHQAIVAQRSARAGVAVEPHLLEAWRAARESAPARPPAGVVALWLPLGASLALHAGLLGAIGLLSRAVWKPLASRPREFHVGIVARTRQTPRLGEPRAEAVTLSQFRRDPSPTSGDRRAHAGLAGVPDAIAASRVTPDSGRPESQTSRLTGAPPSTQGAGLSWDGVAGGRSMFGLAGAEGSGARFGGGLPSDRERAGGGAIGSLWGLGDAPRAARAKAFVYVLDRSGSMQDTFHLLCKELMRAIGSLRDDQQFGVIWFAAGSGRLLEGNLLPATIENKRRAFEAIRRMVPGGRTEPYAAVAQALRLRPDVMYLLSDGDFGGQNDRVLELVRRAGGTPRTTINTILFVYDAGGAGEKVLRRIADLTGGGYRRVGEDELTD